MKKILRIILFLLLSSRVVWGQPLTDNNKFERKIYLGFSAGPLFSKLVHGSENDYGGLGSPTTYKITYENRFKAGFNVGCFAENQFVKHFAIQSELNYLFTKHNINYIKSIGGGGATDYIANYTLTSSLIQLSLLPKLIIGKQSKIYFLAGPSFSIKNFVNINGSFEQNVHYYPGHPASDGIYYNDAIKKRIYLNYFTSAVVAVGANIPVKENNLYAEFRLSLGLPDIISYPNMKQIFASINILYKIKLK